MIVDLLFVCWVFFFVFDKIGLVELVIVLVVCGVELLFIGGIVKVICEVGLVVKDVVEVIGFLEMMDGWVKILYLMVYGGLLGCFGLDDVVMVEYGIGVIDLLVLNLYLFELVIVKVDCILVDVVENIDIGGLVMLCLVVKNFVCVVVVIDLLQYFELLVLLEVNDGQLLVVICFVFLVVVFNCVVQYDVVISNYLLVVIVIDVVVLVCVEYLVQMNFIFVKVMDLCYGENLYQSGVFYCDLYLVLGMLVIFQQLQGKELSYNNLVDVDVVWECVCQFDVLVCVIVKYVNLCGVVVGVGNGDVYELVYVIDLISVFGGIIVFNMLLDVVIVKVILDCQFVEVLIVLDYELVVLEYVQKKVNVCVLCILYGDGLNNFDSKCVGLGLLLQFLDNRGMICDELKVVSKLVLIDKQFIDLLFVWKVVKFVKFNVIVYVKDNCMIGVGVGQMSCVYLVCIVGIKVVDVNLVVEGLVMVFDVFFLFWDGIDVVVVVGIKVVIQLGGLMCDVEVIVVVDEYGLVMVFIGVCYFCY